MDTIPLSALFIALIALLIVSAFFSASETSMMAVNRYRMKGQAKLGNRGARLAEQLLTSPDKLLSVILLGNNLANSGAATLATVIAFRLIGANEYGLTIATIFVTFAILIFSEATPKVIAANYPEPIAFKVSYLLKPLLTLFYPVVWFVQFFVRALIALLPLKKNNTSHSSLNLEELRILVLESSHFIEQKHRSILLNLFELEQITVDDVMTPRHQIEAIDIDTPLDELRKQISTCQHTRLLVYQNEADNILGIVHVRKLLHLSYLDELNSEILKQLLRAPYFIPQGTPLFTQLQQFQEQQDRIGLVVDEYGEFLGLVTLEDILEEIIGEFTSNAPSQQSSCQSQIDGSHLVEGSTSLRELNRKLNLHFPTDGPKTLNGLIIEYFEDIPEAGTCFKIGGSLLEIIQTQDRNVKIVKIYAGKP